MAEDGEGEDEGGELALDRTGLKKFVKIARNKSLTFAFCPASGQDEPLFTVHRRKKPDILGKMARKEAEQTKYACGTMTVDGKTLVLTCDRVVPGMDKKLAKMLRKMKVPLEVKIMAAGSGGGEASVA
ncbi:MAG: hypothetical protein KF887_04430 [Paracoccaceae bacterium]|nr:MAG: hypothetical protein KF887_04430 [Paracoccaceae bacterium]